MSHILNPDVFQGTHKRRHYFEGWYFKLISRDRSRVLALIPGIALGKEPEDAHAFIQVIDARRNHVAYFRYPLEAFHAEGRRFDIRIAGSRFHGAGLLVDHRDKDHVLQGEIVFRDIETYPKTFFHRGIMGPFTFVPFMECRHGIVNLRQKLFGKLYFDGEEFDFEDGEGYVEKDWGRSFPNAWIWLQANHFEDPRVSFMFSLAEIPWLGRRFNGLISFLHTPDGFHRMATYNGSRLERLTVHEGRVEAVIRHSSRTLEMEARFAPGGVLRAPKNGMMTRTIEETISAETTIRVTDRKGNVLFHGRSVHVGMEVSEGARRLSVPPLRDQ